MATFGSKNDQISSKWRFSAQTSPYDQVMGLKSHFWPRNSIQRQKLSKTSILNAIRRFDFRTFWEICKMAPKSGQKWLISAQGKSAQKCRFWGHFTNFSKCTKIKTPDSVQYTGFAQKNVNKKIKHTRAPKSAQKCLFWRSLKMVKNHRVYPLRPILAILPMLQLRRVLSVWAENYFGSSLGQDKALT